MSVTNALSVVTYDAKIVREYVPTWHLVQVVDGPPSMTWRRSMSLNQIRWDFRNQNELETIIIKTRANGQPYRIATTFDMTSARHRHPVITIDGTAFGVRVALRFKRF